MTSEGLCSSGVRHYMFRHEFTLSDDLNVLHCHMPVWNLRAVVVRPSLVMSFLPHYGRHYGHGISSYFIFCIHNLYVKILF
jgi:hypothetical protein